MKMRFDTCVADKEKSVRAFVTNIKYVTLYLFSVSYDFSILFYVTKSDDRF